jgi:uncharacterized membrane protein
VKGRYSWFYLIVLSTLTVIIFTIGSHKTLASEAVNNTNVTSKTPINAVDVIKAGEKSINAELDKARQAIQANNSSEALQIIEEAKQQVNTLSVCATSAIE